MNVRVSLGAASKLALPACDAEIVQVPTRVRCTRAPLTVQLPRAENDTGNPEDELALTLKSDSPTVRDRCCPARP